MTLLSLSAGAELRAAAEELLPGTPHTQSLGDTRRVQVAVLDPAWASQARDEITRRLPPPAHAESTGLEEGNLDSAFLALEAPR